MPSLYDFLGGEAELHRLEDRFYSLVLADDLLQVLFGSGRPEHVDHLTAFTAESFGGPTRFSDELGFQHLIDVHRGLEITEAQRERFVQLYVQALDDVDITDDPEARAAKTPPRGTSAPRPSWPRTDSFILHRWPSRRSRPGARP